MKSLVPKSISLALCLCWSAPSTVAFADESSDSIQAFLEQQVQVDPDLGMVVALVDEVGSKVLSAGNLGNGTDQKVNGDTLFEIGSITKTFTALLLQDTVARGEMKFDDPVAMYLPDSVKMPSRDGKAITLLDLATQTSGLPREVNNLTSVGDLPANPYADYTAERLYAFLSDHTLSRAPGVEFGYSNPGMALLGHAIERKAGQNFETLLVDRICRPLGMDSTRIKLAPELKARLAAGHGQRRQPAPNWEFQVYDGAGGLRSTANDMLKYLSANLGLTPSALTPLMEKMHPIRFRGPPPYGETAMPWMDRGISVQIGKQLLGHAGGTGGYETFIGFDKTAKRGVVVLANQQGGLITEKLGWFILEGVPLTPEITAGMSAVGDAALVGVGLKLEYDRQTRTIQATQVIPNSPASEAGLAAGFVVTKINGVPTAGKSLEHCASLIRGKTGTNVRLEVADPPGQNVNTIELTRRKLQI